MTFVTFFVDKRLGHKLYKKKQKVPLRLAGAPPSNVNRKYENYDGTFYVVMAERACCEEGQLSKGWNLTDNYLHQEALRQ